MYVCVREFVCECVRVYALRIVTRDKILRFTNTLIIFIIVSGITNVQSQTQRGDTRKDTKQCTKNFRVIPQHRNPS